MPTAVTVTVPEIGLPELKISEISSPMVKTVVPDVHVTEFEKPVISAFTAAEKTVPAVSEANFVRPEQPSPVNVKVVVPVICADTESAAAKILKSMLE